MNCPRRADPRRGPHESEPRRGRPGWASYQEALRIAEQIGTRPLAARCHLGLGMLYRATVQPASAQRHLATAATMFRDMAKRS